MIATEMLKEQRLRKLPVNLKTMVDVLVSYHSTSEERLLFLRCLPVQVLPSIQSELPDIRDLAFNCLGLACLHDVSLARNHLLLFLQVCLLLHKEQCFANSFANEVGYQKNSTGDTFSFS